MQTIAGSEVKVYDCTPVRLFDLDFRFSVSLDKYDRDNHYFSNGFEISFRFNGDLENRPVVRGNVVDFLELDYLWYVPQGGWHIKDKSRYYDGNNYRDIATKGWFKKYFEQFLSIYPNWLTEFPAAAIAYEVGYRKSDMLYTLKAVRENKKRLREVVYNGDLIASIHALENFDGGRRRY